MPRFSTRDLLWAALLIAVGICMLTPQFRIAPKDSWLRSVGQPGAIALWIVGMAILHAGLFAVFQRKMQGFKTGVMVAVTLLMILIVFLTRVQ